MSAINPVSGPVGPLQPGGPQAVSPGGSEKKGGFESAIREVLDAADKGHQKSALAIQDLVSGRGGDVLSAVTQFAEADLSFKLLLGVRNKIVEAYKQTMNMQI